MRSFFKSAFLALVCPLAFMASAMLSCSNEPVEDVPDIPKYDPNGGSTFNLLTTCVNGTKLLSETTLNITKKASYENVIYLDRNERFQTIDGFGAAITGSTSYNLMQMTAADRAAFIKKTFSVKEGYGFSYVRVPIGCSDFSLSEYTCCDKEGISNFALTDEENKYIIPVLKEIVAANPGIKIMGTPWTCPRWMKVKSLDNRVAFNSWTNGQLNPLYYRDYAQYFVNWIKAFGAEGIPIYSITIQNEPLNRNNSASLYMSWQEERDFVKTALGPAFAAAGITTKIYCYDCNYSYTDDETQFEYPLKIYEDPEAARFIAGAAYHNYKGSSDELLNVHAKAPDKDLVFSEASLGEWNDGRNLEGVLPTVMKNTTTANVNKWCKAVIVWNLMLDSDQGPNRPKGCQTGYGAVDIQKSDYKTITYNAYYYALAHFCDAARTGAVRIGNSGAGVSGLTLATFQNSDGTPGAVLFNSNSSVVNVSLTDDRSHYANCQIPPKAVVSLNWKD